MSEEKELVKLLQEGDRKTWIDFVEQYKDRLFKIVYGLIPSTDEAENITQDVFIEVYQSIYKFKAMSSLYSWMYRITINKSLNYLKKNKNINQSLSIDDYTDDKINSPTEDASIAIQRKEQMKIIANAVKKLPQRQALVFILHKIDDKSYQEITQITGLTLSSVESLMHRAKHNLQKYLISYYEQNI